MKYKFFFFFENVVVFLFFLKFLKKEIVFNLEDNYKCKIKDFTEEQLKKMNELEVNMLVGHFIGIEVDTLRKLEREEKPFVIQNKDKNYMMIFRFEDGEIKLISVSKYADHVFN